MELTTEVCVIALVVAIALLWLLLASPRQHQPTTVIVAGEPSPAAGVDARLHLNAVDHGVVQLRHSGVPMSDGDTVNLIITTTGTNITITEKQGARGDSPTTTPMDISATIKTATCYPHTIRFDSQITGQWAVLTFTPTAGQTATVATHL